MTIATIIAPAAPPVSLSQVKQHLRIDHDTEDEYLEELVGAANSHLEVSTGQSLINRTLRQYEDCVDISALIALKAWPVREVVAITGYDSEGQAHSIDEADYEVSRHHHVAEVSFTRSGQQVDASNGIEIDFVAGYGDTGLDLPGHVIRAILVLVAHWYEFRGSGHETGLIPEGFDRLLAPVRRIGL